MAAVAWHYNHFSAGRLDLAHFFSAVVNPFFIISVNQCAAAAAAADLVAFCGVQINPVREALVHDPAGFIKISVTKSFFCFTTVIAWVMIYGELCVF